MQFLYWVLLEKCFLGYFLAAVPRKATGENSGINLF